MLLSCYTKVSIVKTDLQILNKTSSFLPSFHIFMGFAQDMDFNKPFKCCIILLSFFCFLTRTFSAPTFLSAGIFESQQATGRNLLQEKKACPVNFEFLNYTIVTSKCKGPQYAAKLCCPAFLEFACPYAEPLNELDNNCASTMFSYINLYGKYPPGLFANECKGDKQGLLCEDQPPPPLPIGSNANSKIIGNPSSILMLTSALLVFILQLL